MENNRLVVCQTLKTLLSLWLLSIVLINTSVAKADEGGYQRFIYNGQAFDVLNVDPASVELHWKDVEGEPYQYFSSLKKALKQQGKTVIALMNAGIYSQTFQPAGLHVEKGKVLRQINDKRGRGNFHLQPNGVFLIDHNHRAAVLTTKAYQKSAQSAAQLKLATQSGPMLIIDGKINAKFLPHSQSLYSRNGVCIGKDNALLFVATATGEKTNFFQFASAMKQLNCRNALYLDGNISKLYIAGKSFAIHFSPFVGILSVTTP